MKTLPPNASFVVKYFIATDRAGRSSFNSRQKSGAKIFDFTSGRNYTPKMQIGKSGKILVCGIIALLIALVLMLEIAKNNSSRLPIAIVVTNPIPSVQINAIPPVHEPLADLADFTLQSPLGALALQSDGKIIVGTTLFGQFFNQTNRVSEPFTRGAIRLNADGTLDDTFRCEVMPSGAAPQMAHIDVLPDGRIFLVGLFGSVAGMTRPNYALLHSNGTIDETFQPWRGETNAPPPFFLPNIKAPTSWGLTSYQGGARPAIWLPDNTVAIVCRSVENLESNFLPMTAYRLDLSGKWIKPQSQYLSSQIFRPSALIDALGPVGFSVRKPIDWEKKIPSKKEHFSQLDDASFLQLGNRPVYDFPFQRWSETPSAADAAKVLQALFEEIPIELCRYAVRLPDGGAILAVRTKESTGLKAPGKFIRFDKNWMPDASFTNQFLFDLGTCPVIKRQADDKLLIAGFGIINGEEFSGLVRLLPDGQIDRSFHFETISSRDGRVMDILIQDDGKIVVCGYFSKVNDTEVPHIARLNPDGSLDASFQPRFSLKVNGHRRPVPK